MVQSLASNPGRGSTLAAGGRTTKGARESGGLNEGDTTSYAALILASLRGFSEIMCFRLIYEGDLKAAGNNSQRAPDKWVLRNRFHSQLASLSVTAPIAA